MMQQQVNPEVKALEERANLVIKNMSNKLVNAEITNANLMAELELANKYIEQLEKELAKHEAPVESIEA